MTNKKFIFPFLLGSEPIKRLLVIDFRNDPEYDSIEPQLFDDSIYGKGLRVLLYRADKKVEVYYQPGVRFDSSDFTVGKGLALSIETPMSPDRFEITESGVDLHISFRDHSGRQIELLIKENSKRNNPFPFLAPVGKDVEKPSRLFLVYMRKFDFIKREGTEINIKIGDRKPIPATFPIKRDGEKVYFARYASNPAIGEINSNVMVPIVFEPVLGINTQSGHNFLINKNQEVSEYWIEKDPEKLKLSFEEGFPNLLALDSNKKVSGHWNYDVSGSLITGGTYALLRENDRVIIEFNVTKKWKPENLPFSFRLFTCFVRSFRTWPSTYQWQGSVDLKNMILQGQWHRK